MIHRDPIKFCKSCGNPVAYHLPDDGDTKQRAICTVCNTVHYENPLVVVGTLPTWENKVLLCKRNIEPRLGKWTLPAGFMELNETTAEGAARETIEEAGAQFELQPLFTLISVPQVGQVHMFYRANLSSEHFNPGFETQEAKLFSEDEIPWREIAFTTVRMTLECYFLDRLRGVFAVHELKVP